MTESLPAKPPKSTLRSVALAAATLGVTAGLAACASDSSARPLLDGTPVVLPTLDPSFVPDPAVRAPTFTPVPPTSTAPAAPTAAAATTQTEATGPSPTPWPTVAPTPTPGPPLPTTEPTATATPSMTPEPTPSPTAEPTAEPTTAAELGTPRYLRPAAPNGQQAPEPPLSADEMAAAVLRTETRLRDPNVGPQERANLGHFQQVLYRTLGRQESWDATVMAALPDELKPQVTLHLDARRAIRGLSSGFASADFIPAWEIVAPAPAEDLLRFYQDTEGATGIDWEYLAAINLLETGLGRIRGLSSAGAQGPMQFMPFTWDEVGEGDVNDPADAILAAGRYLVRRGGPDDMERALWGYNNSDHYVAAVTAYADLLRADPAAFGGLYHWEIYFSTEQGDVWLPVGTRTERIDLADFLAAAPWAA